MTLSNEFIPGYLGTITMNMEDLSAVGNVYRLDQSKDLHTKPVFGNRGKKVLGGQLMATLGFDGHASPAAIAKLQAAFTATAPVAASVQIGEADAETDGGLYTGELVLGTFSLVGNADGEVDFSASGQFNGAPVYTPGEAASS